MYAHIYSKDIERTHLVCNDDWHFFSVYTHPLAGINVK